MAGIIYADSPYEVCPVETTCNYTVYSHSGRIIEFTGFQKGEVYICHFDEIDGGYLVDLRGPSGASPGLKIKSPPRTHLSLAVTADARLMVPDVGNYHANFYNATLATEASIRLSCSKI